METILGFGALFALGAGLGYYLKPAPVPVVKKVVAAPKPSITVEPSSPCRWTSGYHTNSSRVYPGAGVAEVLFPYGQSHKITGLSPTYSASRQAISNGTDGSLVYVD